MMRGTKHYIIIVLGIICLGMTLLSVTLYQRYSYYSALNDAAVYDSSEKEYASRAVDLWSQFNGEPRDQIESSRLPVAIRFENRTCVQLKTIPGGYGGLGGNPIYCFNNDSKQLIYKNEVID